MRLTWKQRLVQQPHLQQFTLWPNIDFANVPQNKQRALLRNKTIVAKALAGQALKVIAAEHHLTPANITYLMNRCLGGSEEESPALMKALVPNTQIDAQGRQAPLPTFERKGGARNAFQHLLKAIPELGEKLDAMLLANLKDTHYSQNLSPQIFHGEFKRILAEANWPKNSYPYTTTSMAYESVRRHFHLRLNTLQAQRLEKKENKRTVTVPQPYRRALQTIQIDEQTSDIQTSFHLELNDELIPLRLARVSIIVAIDLATDCILGYHLALTGHANKQDMLTLLDNCIRPWKPMALTTPGFEYTSGACFPSGLRVQFPISLGNVQLDNALCHLASSVREALCDQQSSTISFGLPAAPKTRRWIEAAFDYINTRLSHRFSSTTGSHTNDPIKESLKNKKQVPSIGIKTFDEALSILLTQYNVTPKRHLGGATPLELFEKHCRNHFIRYTPNNLRQAWAPFMMSNKKGIPVKWVERGKRLPHVNFYGVRYRGEGLMQAAIKGEKIRIEYDQRDIREIHAFSMENKDLGWLKAPLSWQRFPHSLATRQKINKLVKQHLFHATDALASHFRYLLENKGMPKNALEIYRVHHEYTQGGDTLLVFNSPKVEVANSMPPKPQKQMKKKKIDAPALTTIKVKPWSPSFAKHRE